MPYDPLVTMRTRPLNPTDTSALGLAGRVVAAELLARMRKLNLISASDTKAIIGGALAYLDEPGEHLDGPRPLEPSNDRALGALRRYLESWRPPSQQQN